MLTYIHYQCLSIWAPVFVGSYSPSLSWSQTLSLNIKPYQIYWSILNHTVDGFKILHQLKTVVNIPLFIGFQPSFWWFLGFRNHPQYGFPMVFLWFSSGFPLVSYGFPLVFLWFPMVFLWFPMVFLWFSYGFLWFAYGFLGVSEQPHLGFCNEQRLCFGQILWVISTAFDASLRTRRSSLSWRKRLRTVGIFPDFSGLGYLGYLNDPQFMTSFWQNPCMILRKWLQTGEASIFQRKKRTVSLRVVQCVIKLDFHFEIRISLQWGTFF